MSECYSSYGLIFDSDIALPELYRAPEGSVPDVTIRIGRADPGGLAGGVWYAAVLWVGETAFWLDVPEVARFLVEEGRRITVDPVPGVDGESLRVFLLGSVLGALMFQRGFLVLHGNAVRIGDSCLLCVGDSGAGKSTLAAGFLRRGYDVIADDVVPVDGEGRAVPGFPRIKLWQDAADMLAVETAGLARIRPGIEKFNLPITGRHCEEPLSIRWIYLLQSDGGPDGVSFEPVRGMHRFEVLRSNTYRFQYLDAMALKREHLARCATLSAQIRLSRLHRPAGGVDLDEMIDGILADIAQDG